jgi:hypothetical protein
MSTAAPYTSEAAIAEWIDSLKAEGITRLELRPAASPTSVWRRPLAANTDTGKLCGAILARAQSHGAAMPCVRASFFLLAFDTTGGEAIDQQTVVVAGGNAGKGESAEEGTAQERLVNHLLRSHNELHRLLISSQEGRTLASERMIANLSSALDNHEKRRTATLDLYERLVDGHAQRELTTKQFALEEKKADMLERKIDQLTPIVVNRFLGGGPGKGTPYMGEEMVKQLLGSLTPETVEKLMQGLPAEQSALFAELYMAYAAAEEKRKVNEGAKKAEPGGGTNGTINAGANGTKGGAS